VPWCRGKSGFLCPFFVRCARVHMLVAVKARSCTSLCFGLCMFAGLICADVCIRACTCEWHFRLCVCGHVPPGGIDVLSSYTTPQSVPAWSKIVDDFRVMSRAELAAIPGQPTTVQHPARTPTAGGGTSPTMGAAPSAPLAAAATLVCGHEFGSIMINPPKYLQLVHYFSSGCIHYCGVAADARVVCVCGIGPWSLASIIVFGCPYQTAEPCPLSRSRGLHCSNMARDAVSSLRRTPTAMDPTD
jgi:hypothetical protein